MSPQLIFRCCLEPAVSGRQGRSHVAPHRFTLPLLSGVLLLAAALPCVAALAGRAGDLGTVLPLVAPPAEADAARFGFAPLPGAASPAGSSAAGSPVGPCPASASSAASAVSSDGDGTRGAPFAAAPPS
eukprot:3223023-Prymnesium_polylepis.1